MPKAERQRPPGATNEGRRFRRFGNKLLLKFAATRCKIVKAGKLCRITLYSLYNPRYSHMLLLARSTLLYEAQNPRRAMLVKDCLSHNNIVFSVLYCISLRGQVKGSSDFRCPGLCYLFFIFNMLTGHFIRFQANRIH